MSIDNTTIHSGGVWTHTGGSANLLEKLDDGAGYSQFFIAGTSLLDQKLVKFAVKRPKESISAPGGFTQSRCSAYMKLPFVLANGNVTYNTIKVELSMDPEVAEADNRYSRSMMADILTKTEFNDFWANLSIS